MTTKISQLNGIDFRNCFDEKSHERTDNQNKINNGWLCGQQIHTEKSLIYFKLPIFKRYENSLSIISSECTYFQWIRVKVDINRSKENYTLLNSSNMKQTPINHPLRSSIIIHSSIECKIWYQVGVSMLAKSPCIMYR